MLFTTRERSVDVIFFVDVCFTLSNFILKEQWSPCTLFTTIKDKIGKPVGEMRVTLLVN